MNHALLIALAFVAVACIAGGGSADHSVAMSTAAADSPLAKAAAGPATGIASNASLDISGEPGDTVTVGTLYTFTPSASSAEDLPLTFSVQNSPAWASFDDTTGTLSGEPADADVAIYDNIIIAVSDGSSTAFLPAFAINVTPLATGSATVSWVPPTLNSDGSPLTDLAGYRIVYGTDIASLNQTVTIDGPDVTRYVIENLAPGTYFFGLISFTTDGVESELSGIASKTI